MKECKHNWRLFNDPEQRNSGNLTFFCAYCLALKKVKKEYSE